MRTTTTFLLTLALGSVLVACGSQPTRSPGSQPPPSTSPSPTATADASAKYERWFAAIKNDGAVIDRDEIRWARLENGGPTYAQEHVLATRLARTFQAVQDHANSVPVPTCAQQAKADYVNAAGLLEGAFTTIARDTASMAQYGADYDQALSNLRTYEEMLDSARRAAASACP